MMHTNESPMEDPVLRPTLGTLFKDEKDRVWDLKHEGKDVRDVEKPAVNSIASDEFYTISTEITDQDVDHIINEALGVSSFQPEGSIEDDLPRNLEGVYKDRALFCPVILPFDDNGRGKKSTDNPHGIEEEEWNEIVKKGGFIRYLAIDPNDHLTSGFADVMGYFYDYLPEMIQKDVSKGGCSITIDYPEEPGHPLNKIWFAKKLRQALANLRKIMKQSLDSTGSAESETVH